MYGRKLYFALSSTSALLAAALHTKYRIPEIPGPVSSGTCERERFRLKQGLTKTALQILACEAPGKRLAKGGVSPPERHNAFGELVQAGAVVRGEHLPLDDREVNFDLIEPTRMSGRMHDRDARVPRAKLFGGTLTAMG